MTMSSLPAHGRISCARCFAGQAEWGRTSIEENGWILENNPMAWGSSDPKILVLGFSKGVRQTGPNLSMPFEEIAFAGMRGRLAECLGSLGLLPADRSFDHLFRASEPDFAFGSLIRCSVSHLPAGSDKPSKSGEIIKALANRRDGTDWAGNCVDAFLRDLPPRLRLVVLMSNEDDYVEACFDRVGRVRPRLRRINEVAYADDRITFVHIAHCSGTSISHQQKWIARAAGRQGDKARLADAAVRLAGFRPAPTEAAHETTCKPTTRPKVTPRPASADTSPSPAPATTPASPSGQPLPAGRIRVPRAKDGSVFHTGLRRAGAFQIGPKGEEVRVDSFDRALDLLARMRKPYWRRPNAEGNWGIVAGNDWVTVEAKPASTL
ncbi:hypothetical protein [Aurantimonas sp. 22II-16-19i]|uniref:hypothetical protein n=1 Tax=Aurantimonas sp. 22II-16-19i TaxID=1317114 RepID=UPI0009F7AA30|nr:hypothetical protein [Aurantimonas sp. 22II-16-19i]ORE97758.1 hypothetical protein ATO4_07460 [Aurantimonas sp. 22II-16-19i]